MAKSRDIGSYIEIGIIAILAIAALAGIIRFIILAEIF
jgi:hypothetical protein